ncbi:MAG: AAA family ATPase, partial [Lachnospiraceae bacterium]|nr:AAA family ATPase [Lachnospiraceae bacterium]
MEGKTMVTIEQQIAKCERVLMQYGLGEELGTFRSELIRMGYLIAMVDGELDKAELVTINNLFLTRYSQEGLKERFYEDCQAEDCFLNRVPQIIQMVAEKEKAEQLGMQGMLLHAREICNGFKQFGSVIISCNGSRLRYEVAALDRFVAAIIAYIKQVEVREDSLVEEKSEKTANDFMIEETDAQQDIEELLKEVDDLIGLQSVKKEIHNLVNFVRIKQLRESRGFEVPTMSMHLVFTGNPGTGKTTIARKLAEIYKVLGVLENGVMIETDRAGMVAGYMGQTAAKVQEVVEKAKGGILFIDEAYTLVNGAEGDFG